jgi:hypothetical protein
MYHTYAARFLAIAPSSCIWRRMRGEMQGCEGSDIERDAADISCGTI